MPNMPRPRCPDCKRAMEPVFAKRERGETYQRVKEAFWCRTCGILSKGRKRTSFLK